MIELADTRPEVHVEQAEYQRLLGYPRDRKIEGRARELSDWARAWYAGNGRPWVYARGEENLHLDGRAIRIGDAAFQSERLRATLEQAEAYGVVLVAVSAGVELEQEAQKLWQEEKPDEYFFLEIFGSAVVEHLTTMTGARLCAWGEDEKVAVLPHYSPGYPEWDIAEQPQLLDLIGRTGALPGKMEVLESGALVPKKSQLAVFGLTRRTEGVRPLSAMVPCENCSFRSCQFRRTPYRRAANRTSEVAPLQAPAAPGYTVHPRALARWAEQRLSLAQRQDGAVAARFRYDGTTCTNMGRPLAFDYTVELGLPEDGYPILEQHCEPAPGDTGHTYMCGYLDDPERLMATISGEKPLLGRPLDTVLGWQRAQSPDGCYCKPAAREHKWGLVLETIHYALAQQKNNRHGGRRPQSSDEKESY